MASQTAAAALPARMRMAAYTGPAAAREAPAGRPTGVFYRSPRQPPGQANGAVPRPAPRQRGAASQPKAVLYAIAQQARGRGAQNPRDSRADAGPNAGLGHAHAVIARQKRRQDAGEATFFQPAGVR